MIRQFTMLLPIHAQLDMSMQGQERGAGGDRSRERQEGLRRQFNNMHVQCPMPAGKNFYIEHK